MQNSMTSNIDVFVTEAREEALHFSEVSQDVFDEYFTPEKIFDNAASIYEYLEMHGADSGAITREAMFNYASESLGIDYDVIYHKWLTGVDNRV